MDFKLLIFFIIHYASSQMFHEEISVKERAKFFPMATSSEEYEIVPIHHSRIQKRDIRGRNINFEALNMKINLWLNPTDGILATAETPVFTINEGFKLTFLKNVMDNIFGKLYEDPQQDATIFLNEISNGDIELNGRIGAHGIHIRPVSHKDIYYVGKKRRSLENITLPDSENVTYHIVQRVSKQPQYLKHLNISSQNLSRFQRRAINTIYPEILVILDYTIFKLLNGNLHDAVMYTLSFFNGVDLKYRSIDNPEIRLNVAGIIIATDPGALEYMNHYLPVAPYDLIVTEALFQQQFWMATLESEISKYMNIDAAITVTSHVLCANENGLCRRGPVGLATVGGACLSQRWGNDKIRPISGIVHDKCGFGGIGTAAHELGHLLGINHDGEENNFQCNRNEGNIMAPTVSLTDKASEWSFCSLQELRNFLRNDRATCLTNKPQNGRKIPRLLPGKLENADEQCQRLVGTKAGRIDETICTELFCINPMNPTLMYAQSAAAEGTSCGTGKICLRQQCVVESMLENYT